MSLWVEVLPLFSTPHITLACCALSQVGDNVGDIAGMGSDLFGSFAESTCAALVSFALSVPASASQTLGTMALAGAKQPCN